MKLIATLEVLMTYVGHLSEEIQDCCQDMVSRIGLIIYCDYIDKNLRLGLPDPHHWTVPIARSIARRYKLDITVSSLTEARQGNHLVLRHS